MKISNEYKASFMNISSLSYNTLSSTISSLDKSTELANTKPTMSTSSTYDKAYENLYFKSLSYGEEWTLWDSRLIIRLKCGKLAHCIAAGHVIPAATENGKKDLDKVADAASAHYLLTRHLSPTLQAQFINEDNPAIIYQTLKSRFEHIAAAEKTMVVRVWLALSKAMSHGWRMGYGRMEHGQ